MFKMIQAVLIVLFLFPLIYTVHAKEELKVTYIANEGFLLESGDKKVLIDALFGKEKLSFCDVPPEKLLNKMLAAEAPFDDVDLVVVTHDHLDHFDEHLVSEYMGNNPHCELVGTVQTEERLKICDNYEGLKSRIHGITPKAGATERVTLNGIEVSVLRLKHCTYMETDGVTGENVDRHRNKENIGVVLHLGGNRILHIGDSALDDVQEYSAYDLAMQKIDVAMLGSIFWPPFDTRIEVVKKAIQPKRIIAMHLANGNKDRYFAYQEAIQDKLPPITFFRNTMEYNLFPDENHELVELCARFLDHYCQGRFDEVERLLANHAVIAIDRVDKETQSLLTGEAFLLKSRASWDKGTRFHESLVGEPKVMRDNNVACVWAPYKIESESINAKGIDVFQWIKIDGAWQLLSLSYTNRSIP